MPVERMFDVIVLKCDRWNRVLSPVLDCGVPMDRLYCQSTEMRYNIAEAEI